MHMTNETACALVYLTCTPIFDRLWCLTMTTAGYAMITVWLTVRVRNSRTRLLVPAAIIQMNAPLTLTGTKECQFCSDLHASGWREKSAIKNITQSGRETHVA